MLLKNIFKVRVYNQLLSKQRITGIYQPLVAGENHQGYAVIARDTTEAESYTARYAVIVGDITEPYCQVGRYTAWLLSHSGRQEDVLKRGMLSTAFLSFPGLCGV